MVGSRSRSRRRLLVKRAVVSSTRNYLYTRAVSSRVARTFFRPILFSLLRLRFLFTHSLSFFLFLSAFFVHSLVSCIAYYTPRFFVLLLLFLFPRGSISRYDFDTPRLLSRPSMISMIRSNRGDRRTRIIISLRQITWRRSRSSLRFPTLEKERGYVRGVIKHRHPAADQFRRRIDISPFERRKERRKKGRKEGRKEGIGTFRDDSRSILRKCITLGDKEEWRCRIVAVIGTFTDRRASVGRGAIGTLGIDV